MEEQLTNKQIAKLKGFAQRLDAALKVGKLGVTPAFLRSVEEALAHHELIKLKFSEHKEERTELSRQIAEKTQSRLVTIVGHTAVFYRQQPDPEKRRVRLD